MDTELLDEYYKTSGQKFIASLQHVSAAFMAVQTKDVQKDGLRQPFAIFGGTAPVDERNKQKNNNKYIYIAAS